MTHFLYVPFTGLGLHNGYRGEEWLKNRIEIFKRFVIPSLLNQTNKKFILWISWREEERFNVVVKEFWEYIRKHIPLNYVFTFGGLCFWDDKYPDAVAKKRLAISLAISLPQLQQHITDDFVLMTIQPSDDLYLNDSVELIQKYADRYKMNVGFDKGYIIDYATKELAEYNPDTQPPFYTLFFKKEDFLNPDKHPRNKSHEYIKNLFHITSRNFIVGTHGENISTIFNHPYKGRSIENPEKEQILKAAGIWDIPPLEIKKKGLRLYSRMILNKLPFQKQLRSIYHKSKWQPF